MVTGPGVAWAEFGPGVEADRLSPRNFARLAALVGDYCGIKLPPTKQTMVAVRLRRRLILLNVDDLDSYCDYLFEGGGLDTELVHLINAVSTNKTDFFREPAHFDFMWDVALPAMMQAGRRQVKVWSAAASIGAEAYTIAMILAEFRRQKQGPDYSVLGTDISTEVLEVAVAGRFARAMIDPVPDDLRARYVLRSRDPALDQIRIVPQLRAKITWGRLNLMDRHYSVGRDMDLIFCRNILIYFDQPTQYAVLARLAEHLAPGGYLILGHSEAGAAAELALTPIVQTVFQKT